jgi:hypothetical protein
MQAAEGGAPTVGPGASESTAVEDAAIVADEATRIASEEAAVEARHGSESPAEVVAQVPPVEDIAPAPAEGSTEAPAEDAAPAPAEGNTESTES